MNLVHPIIFKLGDGLRRPRIGYVNLLEFGEVTASSETVDYEAVSAYDRRPASYWLPSADGESTLTLELPKAKTVEYFAVHGHNLHENGGSIKLQYGPDGSTWTTAYEINPGSSATIMAVFDPIVALWWRVVATSTPASYISEVAFGPVLVIERNIRVGFTPPTLGRNTTLSTSISDAGEFLGRSIVRTTYESALELEYLSEGWVYATWLPFVKHAEKKPFFFLWSLADHPEEAGYFWAKDGGVGKPSFHHPSFMRSSIMMEGKTE